MKPIDCRTATWEEILKNVEGKRQHVWRLLEIHGPCTTRQLAAATGIDILAIRPRVTELFQLGLARLLSAPAVSTVERSPRLPVSASSRLPLSPSPRLPVSASSREGVYAAVPIMEARAHHESLQEKHAAVQMPLRLSA